MNVLLVGLNHKTASIDVREKFYLDTAQINLYLSDLKSSPEVFGAFILSTCNRVEIYSHVLSDTNGIESFIHLLCNVKGIKYREEYKQYFYVFHNEEAIQHLYEVSTGIDSLVLGEKQILGQIKTAFEIAQGRNILSKNFNVLANSVIRAGKKARSETLVGTGGSSVSWAAVRKAEKEVGSLKDKVVLMIGAGKMSKLAVGQICNKGFKKLYLMNRTPDHAKKLTEYFDGEFVPFCDIKETLMEVDLCICSSSAPHYILDVLTVEKVMKLRKDKPILFIDISMPRNLDPRISEVKGVKIFHIDDLNVVMEENMRLRKEAIGGVKDIIHKKMDSYYGKIEKINQLDKQTVLYCEKV